MSSSNSEPKVVNNGANNSIPVSSTKTDSSPPKVDKNSSLKQLDDILSYIGDENQPRWPKYKSMKNLNKDVVPTLCGLLQDETYKNRWTQIAKMIAWLSDKKDTNTAQVLLKYIRRPDSWNAFGKNAPVHIFGKARILSYLGLFEIEEFTTLLHSAITQEGAEDLIKEWLYLEQPPPFDDKKFLLSEFRGNAAIGLILTETKDNVRLVEQTIEDIIHKELLSETYHKTPVNELPDNFKYDMNLFATLMDAMAMRDIIIDFGKEECLETVDGGNDQRMMQYLFRYINEQEDDNGRMKFKKCPICGITSTP
jgi:hypothetical protein